MASQESAFMLLALPDPCLLTVLQCLAADDQRSLCSAAMAHSRLHQAAVAALHSITAHITEQQQMDSVLLYLSKHGQHVDSIHMFGVEEGAVELRQLPSNLRLNSLQLEHLHLQLQPGNGSRGVLGAAAMVAALKQLQLHDCELLDGEEQLAAALWQLPAGLEHLSISGLVWDFQPTPGRCWVQIPTGVLQQLQQLTYLELTRCRLKSAVEGELALRPLQALTLLQDLRLAADDGYEDKLPADDDQLNASMLSGAHHLTRLEASGNWHEDGPYWIEPGILSGKTRLQHLQLATCCIVGKTGCAQLLPYLRDLQQLTHLNLGNSHTWEEGDIPPAAWDNSHTWEEGDIPPAAWENSHTWEEPPEGDIPAAAFSALTASSKLQHLDISDCMLPAPVWNYMFPPGRQLPHLHFLNLTNFLHPTGCDFDTQALALIGSRHRLVSCCPGLQSLLMQGLRGTAYLLPALRGLTGLHTLHLGAIYAHEPLDGVCQLTRLRELSVSPPNKVDEGLLLQLTQLKQLTALTFFGCWDGSRETVSLACAVSCTPCSSVDL
jgi:hypothetical protein